MRQTSHLYGSALFTIPLIYLEPLQGDKKNVFVLDVVLFFQEGIKCLFRLSNLFE